MAESFCKTLKTELGRQFDSHEHARRQLFVRDEIDQIHRVDLRTKDGDFQVVTKLTDQQRKLLKSLGFTPPKAVRSAQLRTEAA